MSLILDALRKMELERKAKRQSSREIRAEVLNYRGMAAPSEKSRTIPVTAALLLLSAAAAGFFYFKIADPTRVDALKQIETQQQGSTPVMPQRPVLPPPEPSLQKSPPKEVSAPAPPAKPSARADAVRHGSGDEGITVSGIAWQDERSLRRAVINGSLVGEGAEIQGARVVEIRENRVRFSRGGDTFEVSHTSGSGK